MGRLASVSRSATGSASFDWIGGLYAGREQRAGPDVVTETSTFDGLGRRLSWAYDARRRPPAKPHRKPPKWTWEDPGKFKKPPRVWRGPDKALGRLLGRAAGAVGVILSLLPDPVNENERELLRERCSSNSEYCGTDGPRPWWWWDDVEFPPADFPGPGAPAYEEPPADLPPIVGPGAEGGPRDAELPGGDRSGELPLDAPSRPDTPYLAADEDLEDTPLTDPEMFEPVRGTDAKRHKSTGEIWVYDRLHRNHYEVYKNKKRLEQGRRDRSVWDDGRFKEKF